MGGRRLPKAYRMGIVDRKGGLPLIRNHWIPEPNQALLEPLLSPIKPVLVLLPRNPCLGFWMWFWEGALLPQRRAEAYCWIKCLSYLIKCLRAMVVGWKDLRVSSQPLIIPCCSFSLSNAHVVYPKIFPNMFVTVIRGHCEHRWTHKHRHPRLFLYGIFPPLQVPPVSF